MTSTTSEQPSTYAVSPTTSRFRIGLDWGGTKIEGVILDEVGNEMQRLRLATPRDNYEGCIRCAREIVAALDQAADAKALVGVGIPGSLSPATGLVRNGNSVWLNGKPLRDDLELALERPVRIENDANCFAVSEAVDGAGAGNRVVVGIIIGTGLGSGIAIDGRVLTGHNHIAGEIGHTSLPFMVEGEWPGSECWCGRIGCTETFVSGTAFSKDYENAFGERLSGDEIMDRVAAGDARARDVYDRYVDRLARVLTMVAGTIDPDVFVLGGGMSNIDRLYEDLPPLVARYAFSDTMTTPIRKAAHGDSSGVRGAAWLWGR